MQDVITATATIIMQATATATATVQPGDVAAAGDITTVTALAQKIVTDATLISTALFGGIEAFDRKVFRLPGWLKSFLAWVMSGVTPYVWYIVQATQGAVPFDFYILILMGGFIKSGAELLHSATEAAPQGETPVVQALVGE